MKCTKLIENKIYYLYGLMLILSFFLALILLKTQIVFAYDQARDAYEAYNIWHEMDIKILGPSTDITGVFHGALWYYLLSIPYALGKGDPQFTAMVFFILSFFTVPLYGYVTQKIFKNINVSLTCMVLYAMSPLFQATTRWLSNPVISLYSTPFLLLFLWKYLNKQERYIAFFIGILYGILVQSNFSFGLLIFTLPMYLIIFKIKVILKDILFFGFGLLLSLSTFIIAEIKFNGRMTKGMIDFIISDSDHSIISKFATLFERIINLFSVTVLPLPRLLIAVIFLFLIFILIKAVRSEKEKKQIIFLLIWLSNILFFQFFSSGAVNSYFVFIPSLFAITMLVSFLLVRYTSGLLYVILLISIFFFQLHSLYDWTKRSFSPFSIQYGMYLNNEKELIDYTYNASKNETFSISSLTNPLYVNTTWAYLYQFYGEKKYGYLPYWLGKDQEGYLGNLPKQESKTKYNYFIIESTVGIQDIFIAKVKYDQDKISDFLEEKQFGELRVQKRLFRPDKPSPPIPKILLKSHILYE